MDRNDRFRPSGEAELAAPSDETIINGAQSDAHEAIRSNAESRAAPVDRAYPQIAEEIKRRQVSLLVRYIVAARAR